LEFKALEETETSPKANVLAPFDALFFVFLKGKAALKTFQQRDVERFEGYIWQQERKARHD